MPDIKNKNLMSRDDILDAVAEGAMTPDEADQWASEKKSVPFAIEPVFDPMAESFWSLAMISAWIITRSESAVREVAQPFRDKLRRWIPLRRRHTRIPSSDFTNPGMPANGDAAEIVGFRLAAGDEKSSLEILVDLALAAERLGPIAAFEELKRAAGSGGIRLTGIVIGSVDRRAIEPVDWQDLSFEDAGTEIALVRPKGGPAYASVTAPRIEVLTLWPSPTHTGPVHAGAKTQPKARTQPQRTKVEVVLNELYPQGVPERSQVSNKELLKSVGDALKARNVKVPSGDTILRAAKRIDDTGKE